MAKTIKVAGSTAPKKKTKPKRITSVTIRENRGKDLSPSWENHKSWSSLQFAKNFRDSLNYYNIEYSTKDLKPAVIQWMTNQNYSIDTINQFKLTKDWRCSSTMGGIANCLMKGMPPYREDFNSGRNSEEWLRLSIEKVINEGKNDNLDIDDDKPVVQKTIQEKVSDIAMSIAMGIDEHIEDWQKNPNTFDPKSFKIINYLKSKEAKSSHARIIKEYYNKPLSELEELAAGSTDEQLREGYSHRSRKQIKSLIEFYKEIHAACDMITETAKITRKPRTRKPVAKDKLVEKLKYKKSDDSLKLVSINPTDIINAKELWCYNVKSRKLGKYIADELTGPISVKGTTLVGFDENKSIQKTLRKPLEQLTEFKSAGKIALRKFLDDIKAVDIKLNGRINEEVILLKATY